MRKKLFLSSDSTRVLLLGDGVNDNRHKAVVNATKLTALSEESTGAIDV